MDNNSGRLASLDTLRGFDMMFIMGAAGLVVNLAAAFPCSFTQWLAEQMTHVEWDGLRHHDTIFPLFLFIAGVSFPFSLAKQREASRTTLQIYGRVVRRMIALVLLGFVYNYIFRLDFASFRAASVLGRIGIAWGIAAIIYMNCNIKWRTAISCVILLGYWALLALCIAPDAPAGASSLSQDGCIVGYIDRLFLPGKLIYGNFDPEGLLSTVPAIVTALLGMAAGDLVRLPDSRLSGGQKTLYLLGIAVILAIIAYAWNEVLPINKKLWTSSFVCAVGAYSFAMFGMFYYIIDVCKYQRWTLFFRVIGLNSITIYILQRFVDFRKIGDFFLGGIARLSGAEFGAVISSIGYIAACWLVLYFLYRKKVFLKI